MQERAAGQAYDELVYELMMALRSRYGPWMLIHWEDFGVRNAFSLLAKYQEQVGSLRSITARTAAHCCLALVMQT